MVPLLILLHFYTCSFTFHCSQGGQLQKKKIKSPWFRHPDPAGAVCVTFQLLGHLLTGKATLCKKTDCCKSAHLKVPHQEGPQFKLAQVYRWFSGSAGWLCVHKRQARALREMAGIPRPCRYLPRSLPRCLGAHLCIVVS